MAVPPLEPGRSCQAPSEPGREAGLCPCPDHRDAARLPGSLDNGRHEQIERLRGKLSRGERSADLAGSRPVEIAE